MADLTSAKKLCSTLHWLPAYLWLQLTRRPQPRGPVHLMISLADHFEPSVTPGQFDTAADHGEQERRLEQWCREYPRAIDRWRDAEQYPFRHTYFYPAEQYDPGLISRLADHCHAGWGEMEIHLHHGLKEPDTAENTRRILSEFRDSLVKHGCLSRLKGEALVRYGFVHGNWALGNSNSGRFCGVNEEVQILAETGCYADLTLPCAPNPAQVAKVNSLYECALPLSRKAPHRRGRDLERGRPPSIFPLIIQGPLMLNYAKRARSLPIPSIENGEVTTANPPSIKRLRLWRRAGIVVRGRPDWIFIKLHCHGMDPRDKDVMLGVKLQQFLRELVEGGHEYKLHFVTAREMVNIILAICDDRDGNPGDFRDYRLELITPTAKP